MTDQPQSRRISRFLDPALLAQLGSLEVRARAVVEGLFAGMHQSPYRGFNVEFSEYRQYTPGDPLKDIDWKVYARSDKYYIKQHEEETNLSSFLVLDASKSMAYKAPGQPLSKLDYAATLAATLAYLMLRQQDTVGLVTFAAGVGRVIPAKGGMPHLKALCNELEVLDPAAGTDVAGALDHVARTMKKRGLVLVFSDLLDDLERLLTKARQLKTRRHELVIFHVLDTHELQFPFDGEMMIRDMEDASTVETDAHGIRREYLRQVHQFVSRLRSGFQRFGIDYLLIDTSKPLDTNLRAFFSHRRSGMTGLGA